MRPVMVPGTGQSPELRRLETVVDCHAHMAAIKVASLILYYIKFLFTHPPLLKDSKRLDMLVAPRSEYPRVSSS